MNASWWVEGALARGKEILSALIVIVGVFWFFLKPMVDQYIEDAIAGQEYATQGSVLNLTGKTLQNGQSIDEIKEQQIRQEQKLENIEDLSKEMRGLMYQLLQQNRTGPRPTNPN